MKLSKYTIFVPNYPGPDEYLVFNSMTQAMVVINQSLKDAIDGLMFDEEPCEEALEHFEALEELGILTSDEVNEDLVIDHWFNQLKFDNSTFQAVILTTYQCNFGCTYCVEDGVKQNISMDEETYWKTVEWLIRRMEDARPRELRVDLYGGEPLLNIPAVERISRSLHMYSEAKGISFYTTITTNGAFLTEDVVDRLIPYGLKGVKVTLDGDREAHNRKRPFLGGRGSFDLIVDNVAAVADKVPISLGGNFDSENLSSFPRMLDYLKQRGLADKIAYIDFKPIGGRIGSSSSGENGCCSFSEGHLPEDMLYLRREAVKRGFKVPQGMGVSFCSLISNQGSVIIDPLGKIYKCPALVGYEDFIVGDIYHGELNYRHIEFMTMDVWEECHDCPYLPLCGGGCRFMAYLNHGDLRGIVCEREYFERAGIEILKMEYQMADAA